MASLIDIFGYLSVLLRGAVLVCEALVVGGVLYLSVIARRTAGQTFPKWLLGWSSALLAVTQSSHVAVTSTVLIASSGLTWGDVWGAAFWISGGLVVLGAFMVLLSLFIHSAPEFVAIARFTSCLFVLFGSVMSSHSFSRVEHREVLIALTLIHHVAGAAWIGGMPYLVVSLRRGSENAISAAITKRFSCMAMISVALLAFAGAGLSYNFVGVGPALTGTTYGIMLLSKVVLTLMVLLLGALNFKITRTAPEAAAPAWRGLRRLAEVEMGIGFTILLAAASLTSVPPAIDIRGGIVTGPEIAQRFEPRFPRLDTPRFNELSPATPLSPVAASASLTSFVPGQSRGVDNPADIAWSEYNHNCAGLVVLSIGIAALLARRYAWARNWPLLFLGLAAFLLIRADSENWPLGPRGFWESFQVAEVAQHRVFVLLIVVFAIFEWAVETKRLPAVKAGLVFPLVCAAGGALLLTHSHSLTNVKEEFLAELSHLPLAIMAILAGWSRWLEIRLPGERFKSVGWIWPTCLLLIGAVLVNYRES